MSDKVKRLGRSTISDGNSGLGTQFTAIANNMVKPGGHIALILPLSAMLGGSDSPSARSWLKLRGLLAKGYNDIIVVSIAQGAAKDSAFSADTDMAEVIIIARSLRHGEKPKYLAHFVNLMQRPLDKLAAQETVNAIKRTIANLTKPGMHSDASIGDNPVATVRLERVNSSDKWTTVRITNLGLVQAAEELSRGMLLLPQRKNPVPIPMTRMGRIGRVGPLHRDIASGPQEPGPWPFHQTQRGQQWYGVAFPMEQGQQNPTKHDGITRQPRHN